MMHEPSVLFLDAPTSGVDPLARRAFWTEINQAADHGTAILITTHYLEEAEECNRLGFMVGGRLVAEGTPTGIKGRQRGHLLEFIVDEPQRAADLLKPTMERWRIALFGERLHIIVDTDAETGIRTVSRQLAAAHIRIRSAREGRFSLEDVFISVVERAGTDGRVTA
jgi:ABC-2 type transport system ATP-binding protein